MRNKIYFYFILCSFFVIFVTPVVIWAETKKVYIHPSFELCLKLYPRNKEIVNPMVPRISAKSALKLYMERKAIFFLAGGTKQALIPGAILLSKDMIENPPVKFLKKHENSIVAIYCH